MQAHFGGDVIERFHQEVGRSHPVLQCPEDMFDRSPSDLHGLGVALQPLLHLVEHVFVLPAFDLAACSRCALGLDGAVAAAVTSRRPAAACCLR